MDNISHIGTGKEKCVLRKNYTSTSTTDMKNKYYGSIDIGTNAIRMLIKQVYEKDDGTIVKNTVQELRLPIRLGVDVYQYGFISEKKIEQLVKIFTCYKQLFELYNVSSYKVIATSAMREATNGQDVIKEVYKKTGYQIEIISGESEANTISLIAKDCNLDGNWVFVDVGGGSTEVTLFVEDGVRESNSFELGTIRILSGKAKKETWKELEKTLKKYSATYGPLNIVGTGGNINRYYKINKKKTKKPYIRINALKEIYDDMKNLSIQQRIEKYKIKPDRADVIVPAGEIFLKCAKCLKSDYVYVPLIGLGDAIIDLLLANDMDVM